MSVTFSLDGKSLASASSNEVRLWDTTGKLGRLRRVFKRSSHLWSIRSVAFSPDGKTLAFGSSDGMVRLWSTDRAHQGAFEAHSAVVTSIAFSPDGKMLVSGSSDGTVRLWGVSSKQ